jgi:hypothetical protein
MTNTEFIVREKSHRHHPMFQREEIHFGFAEGALLLAFLAAFVGLVLLLSK